MQQSRNPPVQSSGLSSTCPETPSSSNHNLEPEPARNDPWSVPEPKQSTEVGNSHWSAFEPEEVFVEVQLKESGCSFSRCIACLMPCVPWARRRKGRGRPRRRRAHKSSGDESSTSLTTEEERAYLMQCDQLGMERDEEEDRAWGSVD